VSTTLRRVRAAASGLCLPCLFGLAVLARAPSSWEVRAIADEIPCNAAAAPRASALREGHAHAAEPEAAIDLGRGCKPSTARGGCAEA
jgi:hypothetical protein